MPAVLFISSAVFFWSFIGNVLFGRFLKNAPTYLISLVSCGIPSISALFVLMATKEDMALLICPMTLHLGVKELGVLFEAQVVVFFFWITMFVYGAISYRRQILDEKKEDNPAVPAKNRDLRISG